MTSSWKSVRRRVWTTTAVVALGLVAVGLVVLALWRQPAPNAGDALLVTVTPTPSAGTPSTVPASPPQTETTTPPLDPAVASVDLFVASVGTESLIRATRGSCDGSPSVIETSADGGATWVPIQLDSPAPSAVLGINVIGSDQIDIVTLNGAACTPSVLTSYTAGEFWQAYPDRLSARTYFDSRNPGTVYIDGVATPAPCPTLIKVDESVDGALAQCGDQIARYSDSSQSWTTVAAIDSIGMAVNDDPTVAPASLIALADDASCVGVVIASLPAGISTQGVQPIGCAPVDSADSTVGLGLNGSTVLIWTDQDLARSDDGGRTWTVQS